MRLQEPLPVTTIYIVANLNTMKKYPQDFIDNTAIFKGKTLTLRLFRKKC